LNGGILPTAPALLPAGMAAVTSFVQMLVRACRDFLQIDSDELKVGLQPFRVNGRTSQRIFVADALENGSGYSRILGETGTIKKILSDIVNGQPGVLDNGATSKRPSKVRNQDFGCGCVWDKPVRAAQAASTATLSGPMSSSSA
jgi:hypothetical protein